MASSMRGRTETETLDKVPFSVLITDTCDFNRTELLVYLTVRQPD